MPGGSLCHLIIPPQNENELQPELKRGRRKSKTPRETSYQCLHRFHATRAPSCRARTWSTYVVEFLRETSYPCLRRFQCHEGSILQGSDMVYHYLCRIPQGNVISMLTQVPVQRGLHPAGLRYGLLRRGGLERLRPPLPQ